MGAGFNLCLVPVFSAHRTSQGRCFTHNSEQHRVDIASNICIYNNNYHMSLVVRKPVFGFLTWSDANQAVQSQKMARGLKFCI